MDCSFIKKDLFEIEQKLLNHELYETINSLDDVRSFLEIHVLAVWDFMSLLKKLQLELTSVKIPWVPTNHPKIRYLINEIVLAEETDINLKGERKSHFELYYDAMKLIGADTSHIDFILERLKSYSKGTYSDKIKQLLDHYEQTKNTKKTKVNIKIAQTRACAQNLCAVVMFFDQFLPDLFNLLYKFSNL